MENNLVHIVNKIKNRKSDSDLLMVMSKEDAELEIIYDMADALLEEMGEIEQHDNVRRALVNMYMCGKIITEFEKQNGQTN